MAFFGAKPGGGSKTWTPTDSGSSFNPQLYHYSDT
jgi:hypothetical protein